MNILLTTLMLSNMKNSENIQKKTKKCESRTQIPQFIFNGVAEQVRAQGTRGGAEMLGTVDLGEEVVCHGREDVFCSRCPCHVGGGCIHAVGV